MELEPVDFLSRIVTTPELSGAKRRTENQGEAAAAGDDRAQQRSRKWIGRSGLSGRRWASAVSGDPVRNTEESAADAGHPTHVVSDAPRDRMQALGKSCRAERVHAKGRVHARILAHGEERGNVRAACPPDGCRSQPVDDHPHRPTARRIGAPRSKRKHPAEIVDRCTRDHFALRRGVDRTKGDCRRAVAADDRANTEQLPIPLLVSGEDAQPIGAGPAVRERVGQQEVAPARTGIEGGGRICRRNVRPRTGTNVASPT